LFTLKLSPAPGLFWIFWLDFKLKILNSKFKPSGAKRLPSTPKPAKMAPMLTKKKKEKVIKEHQIHKTDTGSPEVQISVLTKQIDELASHLKKNPKDKHSRRGLLQMVADRRAHMAYLKKKNEKRYIVLARKLELK